MPKTDKSQSAGDEKLRCESCGQRFHSEQEWREHNRHCVGIRQGRVSSTGEKVHTAGGTRRQGS